MFYNIQMSKKEDNEIVESKKRHAELLVQYYEDDLACNKSFLDYYANWKGEMGKHHSWITSVVLVITLLPPDLCYIAVDYIGLVTQFVWDPTHNTIGNLSVLSDMFMNAGLSYFELEFFSRCFETIRDEVVILTHSREWQNNVRYSCIHIRIGDDVFDSGRVSTTEDDNLTEARCSFSAEIEIAFNCPRWKELCFWLRARRAFKHTEEDIETWEHEELYAKFSHLHPRQMLILLILNTIAIQALDFERTEDEEDLSVMSGASASDDYYLYVRPLNETLIGKAGPVPTHHRKRFKNGPTLELAVEAARDAASGGSSVAISINVD